MGIIGLGCKGLGILSPIMENQMEKKIETGLYRAVWWLP